MSPPVDLAPLLADPKHVHSIADAQVPALRLALRAERSRLRADEMRLDAVEDVLAARLLEHADGGGDSLLTLDEASKRLATTRDWLRRHGTDLGIVVCLSEGQVRYSARAIDRLIASRTNRQPTC